VAVADSDPVLPLCSAAQFLEGGYADLAEGYATTPLADILVEATRLVEEECSRRLAPFTITETHMGLGINPDEYAENAGFPTDIQGTLGMSYASALGGITLVSHVWLDETPARYPDMWAYSDVSVQIIRSYGGSQVLSPGQILSGPDNTGHIRFTLGTFVPLGSGIVVTYSGGYVNAVPASLVRATKYMAAALILRELDPDGERSGGGHDPDVLQTDAMLIMDAWQR
jgi:hypothetical protein